MNSETVEFIVIPVIFGVLVALSFISVAGTKCSDRKQLRGERVYFKATILGYSPA